MKYNVILADPPFAYRDECNAGKRGACHKYAVMSVDEVKSLRPTIDELAAQDCALFLWVPPPLVVQGVVGDIMRAWKFRPVTKAFTWVKLNPPALRPVCDETLLEALARRVFCGMGHYTRANSEDCWLGVRGSPKIVDHSVRQVVFSSRREHSRKPDEVYLRIGQLMGGVPRVELFARQRWHGWDQALSDQADKFTPCAAVG